MYRLFATNNFERKKKKFSKDKAKGRAIQKCLDQLKINPFYSSLKTHKADIKNVGKVYSSWVLGDLRVAWDFNQIEVDILDLFDIDNHSNYK